MTPEDREMLIRVDQNVINLMSGFAEHIKEDKENFKVLNEERAARAGAVGLASTLYTIVAGVLGAIIGVKYGK